MSDDEASYNQLEDPDFLRGFWKPNLRRAERTYRQSLTSVLVGNAGGAVAVLGVMGAAWRQPSFPVAAALLPLWFFVLGLIALGVGTTVGLFLDVMTIRDRESARSLLDFKAGRARRPSEQAGLSLTVPQTWGGIISGGFFILGCLAGLLILTCLAIR